MDRKSSDQTELQFTNAPLNMPNLTVSTEMDDFLAEVNELPIALGGTGSGTAADARTALGLAIGSDVLAYSAVLDATTASFLIADESKLDAIEALADVTDATNVNAAGAVMESDYTPAHSILVQQSGTGSPSSVSIGTDTILGRVTGGASDIEGLSATDVRSLLNVEDGADVTDTANVTAAGALMDSEVDADIKTLVLPASTTISTFGASLIDDVAASNARTTLDVDQAGTDNSTVIIGIACSDETTDLATGTSTVTFRMPFAMTL